MQAVALTAVWLSSNHLPGKLTHQVTRRRNDIFCHIYRCIQRPADIGVDETPGIEMQV